MKIVIKIGTSTLAYKNGCVNIRRIELLCKIISDMKNAGHEVILVSSGAIGMGVGKLGLKERPRDIAGKQAAAAVGQCELMYIYDKEFGTHNHTVAQLLLTAPDLKTPERREKFSGTMAKLLELGTIPIINENDTVATEEIEFGDNDTLASLVAVDVGADLLVLLSDIDGLYTGDPHTDKSATLIKNVYEVDEKLLSLGGESVSGLGTGGMLTKLKAAKYTTENGTDMYIINGALPELLYEVAELKEIGTRFHGKKK